MKVIFIIFLLIVVMNLLFRALLPVFFRGLMKNMQKRYGYEQPKTNTRKEGEVIIDKVSPPNHKDTEKLGNYVDYEEVK